MRLAQATLLLALLAAPATAQPPPADPIDALLRPSAPPDAAEPAPRRPALTAPVRIEQTGKSPDGPPSPADAAYDSRLKSSQASARGFEGPLDGGWTLHAGGRALYILQLTDRNGSVEGAWRDPRRPGALDASGFIDQVERVGDALTVRFAGGAVAVLRAAEGRWSGELSERGRMEAVSLSRNP
ncbi:hypothetical protein [uncultured Phenylobacterium sp.]|uniref:hypothetical protein n=1 Tax=uncultured Phenylobacterium sp. TaxID=349273 RepID=UPI0025CBA540|nr:hypothetical protein [uncultured Phenylobacterium sp.]